MEKNENEKITFESGVKHSQTQAPQGFSLNEVQEYEYKRENEDIDLESAKQLLNILFYEGDKKEFANALKWATKYKSGRIALTFELDKLEYGAFLTKEDSEYIIDFVSFYKTISGEKLFTVWIRRKEVM